MECEIIRDLLPLYADNLTSESSNRQIEEHVKTCRECCRLRDEMCTPMEPVPEETQEQILERVYRKQRRKTILSTFAIILALVLAVWAFLEVQFSGELIYIANTNEEKILKEMPELALTDEELALAETILEIPLVQDVINDNTQESAVLEAEKITPYLSGILPENGRFAEVFVFGHSVIISIIDGKQYTCMQYTDADQTGHIDFIAKTLTISPLDEIGEDGYLGDVDEVYEITYAMGVGITRCQKLKTRHMWFSFLDMP
jgi:hypothetical protein